MRLGPALRWALQPRTLTAPQVPRIGHPGGLPPKGKVPGAGTQGGASLAQSLRSGLRSAPQGPWYLV